MISKTKKRVVLSIDRDKWKVMKKKAVDAEMTLSEFVTKSLCDVDSGNLTGAEDFKK